MLITDVAAEAAVFDGFFEAFVPISNDDLPPFVVEPTAIELGIEVMGLYFLFVQEFKNHSIYQYGFEYFCNIQCKKLMVGLSCV